VPVAKLNEPEVDDEIGKYPGEQRLKLTMEVTPGTRHAWLYYYQEQVGALELPEWKAAGI